MYAHIDGVLAEKSQDGLVIDCGGVGYYMTASATTLSAAPRTGERMKLFTVLSVREDAMELFGFATREERGMFEKLRGVSGIGPRTALQVLSALNVGELSLAIATGDAQALSRAPGIGKKTAQRLILELRDKVEDHELIAGAGVADGQATSGGPASEAVEALMALGYQSAEAAKAVAAVSPLPGTANEIVFLALKGMGK